MGQVLAGDFVTADLTLPPLQAVEPETPVLPGAEVGAGNPRLLPLALAPVPFVTSGMARLPPIKELAQTILQTATGRRGSLQASQDFLLARRATLSTFETSEEFALAEDNGVVVEQYKAYVHHLLALRAKLATELWSRQIIIGVSVLDEILFHAFAHSRAADPLLWTLSYISKNRLHSPGLVIFPIHSFGILGAGLFEVAFQRKLFYSDPKSGIAISSQTNSLDVTLSILESVQQEFAISQPIPKDLVRHWYRSRSAEWLKRNPLLIVRTQSLPGGSMYENQFMIISKVKAALTTIAMMAALQDPLAEEKQWKYFSSSQVNNFQTLDIHHYIVLYGRNKSVLNGDCVPMNVGAAELAEISELAVELRPSFWLHRQVLVEKVRTSVDLMHRGFLAFSIGGKNATVRGNLYRKLAEASDYFRRSLRDQGEWQSTVALAIAFETLVTDAYAGGVKMRIVRRVKILLKGVRGNRKMLEAVSSLYDARGGYVHNGSSHIEYDFRAARKAFVLCFQALVRKISALRQEPGSDQPLANVIGDL